MIYYSAVGFHNYNLRNFNSRVSNPNKLILDVSSTRCRISMCQGLGQKKHDEISEIDRGSACMIFIIMFIITIIISSSRSSGSPRRRHLY